MLVEQITAEEAAWMTADEAYDLARLMFIQTQSASALNPFKQNPRNSDGENLKAAFTEGYEEEQRFQSMEPSYEKE